VNSVKIDLTSCNGCRTCMSACFLDIIRWNNIDKRPIIAYEEDCVACNACEAWCPKKCITVVPDLAGDCKVFPAPY
jgi:NAD-dependent dihydropyrimidine dehydrogenase PreA subunit